MKRNSLRPRLDYGENKSNGQVLITLLIFVIIALTVISMTITTVISNSQSATTAEKGINVYYMAEGWAENEIMMLLRNPSYRREYLLPDGKSISKVEDDVNGPTITITEKLDNFIRILQIKTSYTNNVLTITSWKEI